jgi:hypothetical protein
MERERPYQLGDRILDRYMPNATAEEREAARQNLRRLARVLIGIEDRLAREWYETRNREAGKDDVQSKQGVAPPS